MKPEEKLKILESINDAFSKPDLSLLADEERAFWNEMAKRCFLPNRHTELVYSEEEMDRIEFLISKSKRAVSSE